jgi:hypothetical protein
MPFDPGDHKGIVMLGFVFVIGWVRLLLTACLDLLA